jgi:hypothetical protein
MPADFLCKKIKWERGKRKEKLLAIKFRKENL